VADLSPFILSRRCISVVIITYPVSMQSQEDSKWWPGMWLLIELAIIWMEGERKENQA